VKFPHIIDCGGKSAKDDKNSGGGGKRSFPEEANISKINLGAKNKDRSGSKRE